MMYRTVTVRPKISKSIINVRASLVTKIEHGSSEYEDYDGDYIVFPDWEDQTLATNEKVMHDDVTVKAIYINITENLAGGNTVYIGGSING